MSFSPCLHNSLDGLNRELEEAFVKEQGDEELLRVSDELAVNHLLGQGREASAYLPKVLTVSCSCYNFVLKSISTLGSYAKLCSVKFCTPKFHISFPNSL